MEEGRKEYQRLLGKLVECKQLNRWPGYEPILHSAPSPQRWKQSNNQLAA
jgi:hypothetical protein